MKLVMLDGTPGLPGWHVKWRVCGWWQGRRPRVFFRRFPTGWALVIGPVHLYYTHLEDPEPLCRFPHNVKAVAVFATPGGCLCYPHDVQQALCLHHAMRAEPRGSMVLLHYTPVATTFDKRVLIRRYGFPGS